MTEPTLEDVERSLERAIDLETEEAIAVLRTARADLQTLAADPDIDEALRQDLENTVAQRLRQVDNRDEYDSELGAAMNPDDDDAP
ncbi:hypothetical protein D8Y22_08845 [Salinadaptatus halalkaliphilus]|uniref:Uncharacterized protein n=2 Tax=Salinadaptatus halalkaliphilus TaxID=2419781 RepID=A0A4S3TMJ1_9EURY|nr:hypothetical protein [Salinadaptatus halalkaliphilus]THE65474.1 hypothetical protein D8Y22_08845 [Salinadaptatus halalkaliphilus]